MSQVPWRPTCRDADLAGARPWVLSASDSYCAGLGGCRQDPRAASKPRARHTTEPKQHTKSFFSVL